MKVFKMKRIKYFMAAFLLSVILFSCIEAFSIKTPEGLAEIEITGFQFSNVLYKAVSPEGMQFKIKKEKNYPEQNLSFWGKALKYQLEKEGYVLITDGLEIRAGTQDNEQEIIVFEWSLPYQNKNYTYLTAIMVYGGTIYIAEAAAPNDIYMIYRENLLDSLKSISLNQ
jgi:hypothetical protein